MFSKIKHALHKPADNHSHAHSQQAPMQHLPQPYTTQHTQQQYYAPAPAAHATFPQQEISPRGAAPGGVDPVLVHDIETMTLESLHRKVILGTGSFGVVYLVQSANTGRFYAMKTLTKSKIVRQNQVEHMNSERSILDDIHHPFIVNLYQTFQDDRKLYLIQEYVIGGEMFFHLRKQRRFSNTVARFYAAEIVLAFEYLHSLDIIYRDLKPENLLIDHDGHIKITDFGFAKRVRDRTWTVCGTPDYMPPEIIQTSGHGKAADWWSLGILIFEMLAGYPPFYDDNPFGVYEKILGGKFKFSQHIELTAQDLILKLLTKDKTRRLGSLYGGVNDIKTHPWFTGIDWQKVANRQIPVPFVPKVTHPGDTACFAPYDEPEEEPFNGETHTEKFPGF